MCITGVLPGHFHRNFHTRDGSVCTALSDLEPRGKVVCIPFRFEKSGSKHNPFFDPFSSPFSSLCLVMSPESTTKSNPMIYSDARLSTYHITVSFRYSLIPIFGFFPEWHEEWKILSEEMASDVTLAGWEVVKKAEKWLWLTTSDHWPESCIFRLTIFPQSDTALESSLPWNCAPATWMN